MADRVAGMVQRSLGEVGELQDRRRLDLILCDLFSCSRSQARGLIASGSVRLNGKVVTIPGRRYRGRMSVELRENEEKRSGPDPEVWKPELRVIYEDEDILVVNKSAGSVVHPGAGRPDGTMLDALLERYPSLEGVPRAGIVHRLDRETSGLMVIGKNLRSCSGLVDLFRSRSIVREYEAVVIGRVLCGGTLRFPIARHMRRRKIMAVRLDGRPAVTHYRVTDIFRAHTRLLVTLETGRTHQIRVHMSHIGHPILRDRVYGRSSAGRLPRELQIVVDDLPQHALHAGSLRMHHPVSHLRMEWRVSPPPEMSRLLIKLREDARVWDVCRQSGRVALPPGCVSADDEDS